MVTTYQTRVGERGLQFSGGERQRITIARVLPKSIQILLLDKATALLGSETEKLIQGSLAKISIRRTTVTIAYVWSHFAEKWSLVNFETNRKSSHRLSAITFCDEIVVLHESGVAVRGTHSSLLQERGQYLHLWYKQSRQRFQRDK